ncbi:MAG TPA: methyltransferase domain-containing protein [Vicinamibacterales bacterium]|nr:methyltransferase domain-containing protein [Vicinamibacterales bacterium]
MLDGPWVSEDALSVATLDGHLIERLYAQCASFYDRICGPMLQAGRREAMRELALRPGHQILEIGIGTGLTAPLYPSDCTVTGIDVSAEMLREAAKHIDSERRSALARIQLLQMDAANLKFPDESFDVVYAAYVISVVPDPLAVIHEMHRVCRVCGHIVLLNHFLSDSPFLAKVERMISPLTTARRVQDRSGCGATARAIASPAYLDAQGQQAEDLDAHSLPPRSLSGAQQPRAMGLQKPAALHECFINT